MAKNKSKSTDTDQDVDAPAETNELTTDLQDSLDDTADLTPAAEDSPASDEPAPEPAADPPEPNAWLDAAPEDGGVDREFVSAALGIPTGLVEQRLKKCNQHELEQIVEARKTASHQMVRAQIANAMNRASKPNIPKGKKPVDN